MQSGWDFQQLHPKAMGPGYPFGLLVASLKQVGEPPTYQAIIYKKDVTGFL